jgi:hypothetical protein
MRVTFACACCIRREVVQLLGLVFSACTARRRSHSPTFEFEGKPSTRCYFTDGDAITLYHYLHLLSSPQARRQVSATCMRKCNAMAGLVALLSRAKSLANVDHRSSPATSYHTPVTPLSRTYFALHPKLSSLAKCRSSVTEPGSPRPISGKGCGSYVRAV